MLRLFQRKKNITERDSTFYDDMYRSGGHLGQYHVHYTESLYLPVWRWGAGIISALNNPRVLDIGCGPGQFAHLLFDCGIVKYTGIDHSAIAISLAQKNVPQWAENFTVADIFTISALPEKFDIVVLFEVLEHLERDLDLLRLISPGTRLIFSVPSFSSKSHVRQFKTPRKVEKRYRTSVDIIELKTFSDCPEPGKSIFSVYGTIRSS